MLEINLWEAYNLLEKCKCSHLLKNLIVAILLVIKH